MGAWGIALAGACRDLGAHAETAGAWAFPHVLGPESDGREEGESPKLTCWCCVLVDWAGGTWNGLGTWVGPGEHMCQEIGTLVVRQSSRSAYHHT